jgi:predicted nucleotidyltransferase
MRDKRSKFVQLANQRVTKAIDQIRLIGNLSNRSAYEFDEEDIKKIVKALQKAVDSTKARFSETGASGEHTFSLE